MPKKNLWVKIEASEDVALSLLARERETIEEFERLKKEGRLDARELA